jgi:hypothetical protein
MRVKIFVIVYEENVHSGPVWGIEIFGLLTVYLEFLVILSRLHGSVTNNNGFRIG